MVFFLIPAYNEAENLPSLLKSIKKSVPDSEQVQFVIVNDGSNDETNEVIQSLKKNFSLESLHHKKNHGPGAAFNTGYKKIMEIANDEDIVISIEADNTSDLSILPQMIQLLHHDTDLVLSSCYAKGGKIKGSNWFRLCISAIANLLISILLGLKSIHTYSSFYRGVKVSIFKKALSAWDGQLITHPGFICMVEMLVKLSHFPIRIREIPSTLNCNLRKGKSKMKVFRTTFTYIQYIIRELFFNRKKNIKALQKWNCFL